MAASEFWLLTAFAGLMVVGWGLLNPITLALLVVVDRRWRAWCAAAPIRRGVQLALLLAAARIGFGALLYALCHVLPLVYGAFLLVPDVVAGYSLLECLRWELGFEVPEALWHVVACGISTGAITLATLPLSVGAAFWAARLEKAVRG